MKGLHSAFMGRTGPAVPVASCGCNVLPWEACDCEQPWDDGLSLDRVIRQAREYQPEQLDLLRSKEAPPVLSASAAEALSVARMRSLLGQCRQVARWSYGKRGHKGELARTVVTSIDKLLQERSPA
jgi:hypothetical protein